MLDSIAIGASFACLMHCLALPLLLAALPAASKLLDVPESFHLMMLAIALPISAFALVNGYRKHGATIPSALGVIGLSLMSVGVFWSDSKSLETGLTVLGSVMLALAHIGNWQILGRKHYHPS